MSKRDTYRYTLRKGGRIVQYGITNDPERREQEHRGDGKRFDRLQKEGPRVIQETAENWEEERLASYRKTHRGRNPAYNETDR